MAEGVLTHYRLMFHAFPKGLAVVSGIHTLVITPLVPQRPVAGAVAKGVVLANDTRHRAPGFSLENKVPQAGVYCCTWYMSTVCHRAVK